MALPCQIVLKFFRFWIATGSTPEPDVIKANAEYFKQTLLPRFKKLVTPGCYKRVEKAIDEYIATLPDKRQAWKKLEYSLSHEIDLDYRYYGVTKADWRDYENLF